jgi:hypothetical protein
MSELLEVPQFQLNSTERDKAQNNDDHSDRQTVWGSD